MQTSTPVIDNHCLFCADRKLQTELMSPITGMLSHADQTHCMQLCEVQVVFSRHKAAGDYLVCEPCPDELVDILSLLGCGHLSCPNGPDWFIRYDHIVPVCVQHVMWSRVMSCQATCLCVCQCIKNYASQTMPYVGCFMPWES